MLAAPGDRRTVGLSGCDQWVRAAHSGTAVGPDGVGLHWELPDVPDLPGPQPAIGTCTARGLAFDRFCRAYLADPDNVLRVRLGDTALGVDYARVPPPTLLFDAAPARSDPAQFEPAEPAPALDDIVGIAVDDADRLVIAERGASRVLFVDLWQRRIVRIVATPTPPIAIAVDGNAVHVLIDGPALLDAGARTAAGPGLLPPLPSGAEPYRMAVAAQRLVLLARTADGHGWLISDGVTPHDVGPASDLAADGDRIVVAPCAGGRFLVRYAVVAGAWEPVDALDATDYDGTGIALTPAGRICYRTAAGLRLAVGTRVHYTPEGRVVTFRLDAGQAGARWGRVFVEACVPPGTDVQYAIRTSDDATPVQIPRTPADPVLCVPYRPELSPALPPPGLDVPTDEVTGRLYPRADSPTPWWRLAADDNAVVLEGYVAAPAGRYAWVTLRLLGTSRLTPVVRSLRVEAETHSLTRRLPEVYVAQDDGGFLHRFLALFDGTLQDLDRRAVHRDLLVHPASAPVEALPWLASFLGMVLDDRWAVADRRQLVAEAAWLYRYRGTIAALARYLALYLHVDPVIVEHYRLRGVGGPTVGSDSVLGFGLRVGGALGEDNTTLTPFAAYAHRFSVLIPRPLDAEQLDVVRTILDRERPAHTTYELCTVDAGLRVGIGDHLDMSAVVGRTGGFAPIVIGHDALLGEGLTLGRAVPGVVVEAARVGQTEVG